MNLPMAPSQAPAGALSPQEIAELQQQVRALAAERGAVILAHNYQLPEIQDVADYVGDSLGLSRRAAAADGDTIVFCGVHFMAETASVLCPSKTVLIPDLDAGCSLAGLDRRRAAGRLAGALPAGSGGDVREHHRRREGAQRLLLHLGQRGRGGAPHLRHPRPGHGDPVRPRHVARGLRREGPRAGACTCGTASATCTPGSVRRTSKPPVPATPGPSCWCTPSAAARRA